jgi:hypothetical protein
MLDPDRKPMPQGKWERVKTQVRENMRLIRVGRASKRLEPEPVRHRPNEASPGARADENDKGDQ